MIVLCATGRVYSQQVVVTDVIPCWVLYLENKERFCTLMVSKRRVDRIYF